MFRNRATSQLHEKENFQLTHEEEREDDTPDKDPFGDTEPHIHCAVVPAFTLDCVRPLKVSGTLGSKQVELIIKAKGKFQVERPTHMVREDIGGSGKDIKPIHRERFEDEDVLEHISDIRAPLLIRMRK